ncbi:MAG TPA: hypothetical protein VGC16_09830 [Rhizomicrobium sp.]
MPRLLGSLLCVAAGLLLGAVSYLALAHFQLRPSAVALDSRACYFCGSHFLFPRHPIGPRPKPARPYRARPDLDRA